ncbi:MAG: S-methyl-5-thioribose-1-phosphate isomerase [Clostridia bacterium]|nr:S-methyl-5-thioribose-1-phosphate isomerase [Clostridia bacterium]
MEKEIINILETDTVNLSEDGERLVIIDQSVLPGTVKLVELRDRREIIDAIKRLRVRGAPAIGVAAGIAVYLSALDALNVAGNDRKGFMEELRKAAGELVLARPTAVNLKWAVDRMMDLAEGLVDSTPEEIVSRLRVEALTIKNEDIEVCRKLGENGLPLLKRGQGILTHCNAGHLATVRYGTATAPIYLGQERGYGFHVYADETRPLLQGARLTSTELQLAGVDVTLICDNMAASVMKEGKVQTVITGCDRVAANGDSANKIGTLGVAILAKHYGIPLYIAAPTSTIDMGTATGEDIVIEQRDGTDITDMWYSEPMALREVRTYNPAFDVTDHELIAGIITEYGVAYPPYDVSLRDIMEKKKMEQRKEVRDE